MGGKVISLELSEADCGIQYKKKMSRIVDQAHTQKNLYHERQIYFHDSREGCPGDCEVDMSAKFWVDPTNKILSTRAC